MKHLIRLAVGLSFLFGPLLLAQSSIPNALSNDLVISPVSQDPVKEELEVLAMDSTSAGSFAIDPADPQNRFSKAEKFVDAADKAKLFQEKYPDRKESAFAKIFEARDLLNSALVADSSRSNRAGALVDEVRSDLRVSPRTRLEIVALSEMVRLQPAINDRIKFLAASEASARNLIAEFPVEAGGYEALFRLAESQLGAKGIALAKEVMAMPAPAQVRDLVQVFLDRQALVGQSLLKIGNTALGADNVIAAASGKAIILYSWTTGNPGSVAYAANLSKVAPPVAVLIGVNLDKDSATAKIRAQSESLPGFQIYDDRGTDSPLAVALKLTTAGHVYVANSRGEIRDVSVQRGDFTLRFNVATR